jgi:hypothetical protein
VKSFLVNTKEKEREYIIIDKDSYNDYKRAACFPIGVEPAKGVVDVKEETLALTLEENYIIGH